MVLFGRGWQPTARRLDLACRAIGFDCEGQGCQWCSSGFDGFDGSLAVGSFTCAVARRQRVLASVTNV